jgi:hypothetical protein
MIAELRSKIVSASALIREVQGLVDIGGAVDTLRHVLEWTCSAHSVGPEDLSWAHSPPQGSKPPEACSIA